MKKWGSAAVLSLSLVVLVAAAPLGRQVGTTTVPPSTTTTSATTTTTTTLPPTTPSTTARTTTTTVATTTTSSSTTTSTSTTTTTLAKHGGTSGLSGTTIGLIVGAIAAAFIIMLLALFLMRRQRRARWRQGAQVAVGEASTLLTTVITGLPMLSEPSQAATTWSRVETLGAPLHRRLQALVASAPDELTSQAAAGADRSLEALRAAVEADRTLRLGPPPPTNEQLRYSEAVLRQRAAEFEQAIADLDRVANPV